MAIEKPPATGHKTAHRVKPAGDPPPVELTKPPAPAKAKRDTCFSTSDPAQRGQATASPQAWTYFSKRSSQARQTYS